MATATAQKSRSSSRSTSRGQQPTIRIAESVDRLVQLAPELDARGIAELLGAKDFFVLVLKDKTEQFIIPQDELERAAKMLLVDEDIRQQRLQRLGFTPSGDNGARTQSATTEVETPPKFSRRGNASRRSKTKPTASAVEEAPPPQSGDKNTSTADNKTSTAIAEPESAAAEYKIPRRLHPYGRPNNYRQRLLSAMITGARLMSREGQLFFLKSFVDQDETGVRLMKDVMKNFSGDKRTRQSNLKATANELYSELLNSSEPLTLGR